MKNISAKVISDKTPGMAVVEVNRWVSHAVYHKRVRKTAKYHARNLLGAKTGDVVIIRETRPLSATIRWRIIKVVTKVNKSHNNGTA